MRDVTRQDLREAIVSASLELAAEVGEEGVTMRGIAKRLGISATAIYQYFEGKAAIMQAIRMRGLREIRSDVIAAFAIEDRRECMVEMSNRYLNFARNNPWLYAVLMQGEDSPEAVMSTDAAQVGDLNAVRSAVRDQIASKLGQCFAAQPDRLGPFLARWWCGLHGAASLMIGGRLNAYHPILPIEDLEVFGREYAIHVVDALLKTLPPEPVEPGAAG